MWRVTQAAGDVALFIIRHTIAQALALALLICLTATLTDEVYDPIVDSAESLWSTFFDTVAGEDPPREVRLVERAIDGEKLILQLAVGLLVSLLLGRILRALVESVAIAFNWPRPKWRWKRNIAVILSIFLAVGILVVGFLYWIEAIRWLMDFSESIGEKITEWLLQKVEGGGWEEQVEFLLDEAEWVKHAVFTWLLMVGSFTFVYLVLFWPKANDPPKRNNPPRA